MSYLLLALLALVQAAFAAAPTVAIADLANDTGDARFDAAGPGVAALLITRFARTDAVRVVERERLQEVLAELDLSKSGLVDPNAAVKAGRLLGARYVVTGSLFTVQLPTLAVSVRVIDTETGQVVAAEEVVGDVGGQGEHFFVLLDDLSARILAALPVTLSGADRIELAQVDIRELEALLKYGKRITAPPQDHPKAMWRDKSRDMMEPPTRDAWVVYNNEGSKFTAEAFARAVGDVRVLTEIDAARGEAYRRARVGTGVGLGITGVGAVMAAAAALSPGMQPGARIGLGVLGGTACTVGLTWTWGANLRRAGTVGGLMAPGRWWSPEEADKLITAYNEDLE